MTDMDRIRDLSPADTANQTSPAFYRAQVAHIVTFFETITPQNIAHINTLYTPDAYFKDPFNEVRGHAAITQIFEHMFVALEAPRFIVTAQVVDDRACFLSWDFKFRFKSYNKSTEQTVRGGSHLLLDAQGKIESHRDYWDAAEELYEKLPLVSGVMRWLKKRANS